MRVDEEEGMRVQIIDAPVRQNVEIFLNILRRVNQKKSSALPTEKDFPAWVHRNTGELRFEADGNKKHSFSPTEWKVVKISYYYTPKTGEIWFCIEEPGAQEEGFHTDDLDPLAFQIMRDTMKVFNEICRRLKGPSGLDAKMAVVNKLQVQGPGTNIDRNILIGAWHFVDRKGAEELLWKKPVGSYLFRKDPYVKILEQELTRQHHKEIKCITLTYLEPHRKITDLTLVHVDHGWQIYNDDPSLKQRSYSELEDLLVQFKDRLKFPFYT